MSDIVSTYYAAFNSKDWTGMLACLTDDVRHDVNEGAERGGKAKFAEFLAHMDHCYDEQLKEIVVMSGAKGARAAAEFIVHGTYRATDGDLPLAHGQTYVLPAGAFFEIKNGLIARVTTYYNLKNWLAQIA